MPDKPINAIICSRRYPEGDGDVHEARKRVFGPILSSERVQSRGLSALGRSFVTALGDDGTLAYGVDTDKSHEYRHDWFVGEIVGGKAVVGKAANFNDLKTAPVLFGFLKD